MGKAENSVTEETASRSFSVNGVNLRLPTDGNPAGTSHVNPGPNSVGEPDYADGRDIYTPDQTISGNASSGHWYVAQGTSVGNSTTPASGSSATNNSYDDLLAVWDAHNGTATNNSVYNTSTSPASWDSLVTGAPSGWATGDHYWSATASAGGHATVVLDSGLVNGNTDHNSRFVALQVV